jgi:16S rRNA (adenine1518-N6/adenine1519-N6)-dimethyltransferase
VKWGPGKGALSYHLLDKIPNYKLIEADKDMVAHLEQHIPKIKDHIYQHDFLKFNLKSLFEGKAFLLFGNYPYNISSQIVIRTLENSNQIPYMIGMFQKEMALRIVSSYGSKDYGPLSILSSLMYDRQILI